MYIIAGMKGKNTRPYFSVESFQSFMSLQVKTKNNAASIAIPVGLIMARNPTKQPVIREQTINRMSNLLWVNILMSKKQDIKNTR